MSPLRCALVVVGTQCLLGSCAGPATETPGAPDAAATPPPSSAAPEPEKPAPRTRIVTELPGMPVVADTGGLDWSKVDPLQFLGALMHNDVDLVTVWGWAPPGWVEERHVPALLQRIDSTARAAHVMHASSSILLLQERDSTEGEQAMFLVYGFKSGRYPPNIASYRDFPRDPEVYRRWWREHRARK